MYDQDCTPRSHSSLNGCGITQVRYNCFASTAIVKCDLYVNLCVRGQAAAAMVGKTRKGSQGKLCIKTKESTIDDGQV